MKITRILALVLAALLLLGLLPLSLLAQAKEADSFSGNRTVEFTFSSSDLDNFANGGRPGVDLYLRRNAPQWLSYTLGAKDYEVQLTYSFDFTSYEDYYEKVATLLTYQPGILYQEGKDLILVEEFEANALLGSLVQSLGNSLNLPPMARITQNTLTIGGESYEFPGQKIAIYPEIQSEIPMISLDVLTEPKGSDLLRTVTVRVAKEYAEHEQWQEMVDRFDRMGSATVEEDSVALNLQVKFRASNAKALAEMTAQCLDMPVGVSIQLTQATEESCSYLRTESFLTIGRIEESGSFTYRYYCPATMTELTPIGENVGLTQATTENEDGTVNEYLQVSARNRDNISFSYNAPFAFDEIRIHTDWASSVKKIQRTITLTAPVHTAKLYHKDIKQALSDEMPKGTVLEIYDQDQTRYYVLKFASWFWEDIQDVTACYLETELVCQDSWLPMGESSFAEEITDIRVIEGYGTAGGVHISYRFPGGKVLDFTDTTDVLEVQYAQLNIWKLAVEVLALAVIAVAAILLTKAVRKALKNRTPKEKKPKAAPTPVPEAPKPSFCGNCGTAMQPSEMFCPNCGSPRQ